jgi:chaperonin GroES
MAKIRPLGDRVVVKPEPKEETTRSGIVIPETAKENPQEGTVTAVGSGRLLDNGGRASLELRQGDHVLFAKYSGTEMIVDDEIYLILRENDVLAVLDS